MSRLSNAALPLASGAVQRPAYDRSAVTPGIVHLGIGAFHRAHQAVMVDDRLAAGEMDWGIIGASLRSAETAAALNPQDGLYTIGVRSGEQTDLRVIGAIAEVLVATTARAALIAAMSDPKIRIVSLTVTEKGYCHDPARGELDETNAGIRHDLANPDAPETAPGLIVAALARRRAAGIAPFTVLTCDNLPANGQTVHRVLSRLGALIDPALGAYIAGEVACPATMVDRIVPATTDQDRALVAAALGVEDAWPVMTEPFSQWVIEDRFPTGRPAFEAAGAELVTDVARYETMKLRLLNGTHSTMAYLGQLAGLETVCDAISHPAMARFIRALMDEEIGPTVKGFGARDLDAYKDALIARYGNSALRHRTAQIAMDGSQKVPQRLLNTIRDRLAAGQPIDRLALALAGFLRFMAGTGEDGASLPVNDPRAQAFAAAAERAGATGIARRGADDAAGLAARLAGEMLGIREVFGDLGTERRLFDAVAPALARLYASGARATLAAQGT